MTERVEIGPHVLYRADCREVLDELRGVDAVVTDPQYADINRNSSRFSGGNYKRGQGRKDHLSVEVCTDISSLLIAAKVIVWGYQHFARLVPHGTVLVWDKCNAPGFLSDAEVAWMRGGSGVYIYRFSFPPPVRMSQSGTRFTVHPHQKPVELMAWCLEKLSIQVGEVVCDPQMGSGTTGVACANAGIAFRGVEKEREYFDVACKRIEYAESQLRLFA